MAGLQTAHASVIGDSLTASTQAFIDQSSLISVPYTTIVGRAQIPDIANDLRASLGVERIPVQSIYLLQNEFGTNGGPVWAALNDTRGLIRFVGAWQNRSGQGNWIQYSSPSDYVELVIYGTGINLLTQYSNGGNFGITVDGNSETTVTIPATSTVLDSRNYANNEIFSLVSGLSLGLHTIKIRTLPSLWFVVYGFEIINSNASGLININPGTAYYSGQKIKNNSVDSIAYNTGVTGTKGGRIVRYITAEDTLGQAFQAVDASSITYPSTVSHTNEEIARSYRPREFGVGRNSPSDDFSLCPSAGASDRSFTLEDGTTTLIASNIVMASYSASEPESVMCIYSGGNGRITFTFVGCGLDILLTDRFKDGTTRSFTAIYIDGISLGTSLTKVANSAPEYVKIASGLAYGTHTVRFETTNAVWSPGIAEFKVYQPRKPTFPTGIELADYCVMGTYSATTSAISINRSEGVLRKTSLREMVYVGAGWTVGGVDSNTFESGFTGPYCGSGTGYFEYTFWGTGIEVGTYFQNASYSMTVAVDGSSALTGKMVVIQPGGLTVTPASGTITGTASPAGRGRIQLTGFTLGVHTVRVTWVIGSGNGYLGGVDIITPIHSHKSNLYGDLQNTLPVGSQSIMDSRATSPQSNLSTSKAWVQAVGIGTATTSVTSYVPMSDMSVVINVGSTGARVEIIAAFSVTCTAGVYGTTAIYVDGVQVSGNRTYQNTGGGTASSCMTHTAILPMSKGVHKVDIYWKSPGSSTVSSESDVYCSRVLTVKEL